MGRHPGIDDDHGDRLAAIEDAVGGVSEQIDSAEESIKEAVVAVLTRDDLLTFANRLGEQLREQARGMAPDRAGGSRGEDDDVRHVLNALGVALIDTAHSFVPRPAEIDGGE